MTIQGQTGAPMKQRATPPIGIGKARCAKLEVQYGRV